jgi:hypothetical protein
MEIKMFYDQNGLLLEKVEEPPLKLTHWDFVIKEMVYLSSNYYFWEKFYGNIKGNRKFK